MLVTEQDIPKVVFQNINWLYPAQRDELDEEAMHERVAFYVHQFDKSPEKTIIEVAKRLDIAYDLPEGQSLLEIRQLLARRCFLFDILIPSIKLKAGELQAENMATMSEALRVSNK